MHDRISERDKRGIMKALTEGKRVVLTYDATFDRLHPVKKEFIKEGDEVRVREWKEGERKESASMISFKWFAWKQRVDTLQSPDNIQIKLREE